jgi:DNA polymerase III delta prime subunit
MSNIMQLYQPEFNKVLDLYQKKSLHSALLFSGAEASCLDVFCRELACKMLGEDSNKDFCPDLKIIKYDETKAQKIISVDQIREINNFMLQTSYLGGAKITIINSVNNLNKNSANALLKILEEPPKNSFFFLICHDKERVLDTIKSRSISVNMPKLSEPETVDILKTQFPEASEMEINNAALIYPSSIEFAIAFVKQGFDAVFTKINQLNANNNSLDIEALVTRFDLKDAFAFKTIVKIIYHLCYEEIVPKDQEPGLFGASEMVIDQNKSKRVAQFLESFTKDFDELKIYNLDKVNFLRIYLTQFKQIRNEA